MSEEREYLTMENKNYHKEFWHHKTHYILAGCCFGVLMLSGHLFGAIVAVTAYVAGIINIPEMKFFKNMVDKEAAEAEEQEQMLKAQEFRQKRDDMFCSLSPDNQATYRRASSICRDIEQGLGSSAEVSMILKKIDELMWTYLKLLSIRQSLWRFLDSEDLKEIDRSVKVAQSEIEVLTTEIDQLKKDGNNDLAAHKEKLLLSVQEKMNTIRKRADRYAEAQNNIEVVKCEESRLLEQIKLVRADAIATKNATGLSLKIDSTISHLDETNKWLSELKDYQDISDEIPQTSHRVGFMGSSDPYGSQGFQQPESSSGAYKMIDMVSEPIKKIGRARVRN